MPMTKNTFRNLQTLKELYAISAPSGNEFKMVNYIDRKLKALGAITYRDSKNNLYAIKGKSDTYPCIVAHTDEVHRRKPKAFTIKEIGRVLIGFDQTNNQFAGIGADDKNGIWVALQCFEKYDVIKGAFFVEEETGCYGSSSAIMSFFDDARFVLQCDRMNGYDFITNAAGTKLASAAFVKAAMIERHGYRETTGSITDVMQLKENGLKVSACNISCGYHSPHTPHEHTNLDELANCLALVESIIENCLEVYPHRYEAPYYNKHTKQTNGGTYASKTNDYYNKRFEDKVYREEYLDWWNKTEAENNADFNDMPELEDEFDRNRLDNIVKFIERRVLSGDTIDSSKLVCEVLDLYPMTLTYEIEEAYREVTGTNLF